jgi:hypothetical protein
MPNVGSFSYPFGTLLAIPWVTLPAIHGEKQVEVLVGGIQDEGKMVDSPKILTVTMFSRIVTQLLELQLPGFLVRLAIIETNFVEPPSSFRNHSADLELCTLINDPFAQFRVFLVPVWHIACNSRRETGGGVSGGIFKMKVKRSTTKTTHSDHAL